MSLGILAALCAVILYTLGRLCREAFTHYPHDALRGPQPQSFLRGNQKDFFHPQAWKRWAEWAATYGSAFIIRNILGARIVVLYDPKAIHAVMVKDQNIWTKGSGRSSTVFSVLLGPGLLSLRGGEQHRRQRKMLNPVFSVAHLRNMTHIFYHVAHRVDKAIKARLPTTAPAQEVDINDWMSRATLEMLGQAGLGYSFDDFAGDSADEYGESIKLFFPHLARTRVPAITVRQLSWLLSDSAIRTYFRTFPSATVREVQRTSDTMATRSAAIVQQKKAALEKGDAALKHEVGEGKDIMSICLRANMATTPSERLSDEELVAQMSTFILAGMDTTANALSRILWLLAAHPDVQTRLRAELVEAQGGARARADVPYDDLVKLPYLDAVCRETLRVYAPVLFVSRAAAEDTVIPLSAPAPTRDGGAMSEIPVARGTTVLLLLQASNVNPALWGADAAEWRPERWLAPLPAAVEDARVPGVYAHLMTFAAGARACIGFKFSQLEMKVVLAVLLTSFSFELTDKEVRWNMSAVMYPSMEDSCKPGLLLRVKPLKE
ncbi:cytochrome P450 [Epithele typhae]|uniref:cytochrome P450 n=1 Tax=Epithele typhae TaxID=378194 RepID=UPI0020073027|nr:cytochrome P450 [Epithele typhae]KAH9941100.1 cytochrome P450 [Epithele typhae]